MDSSGIAYGGGAGYGFSVVPAIPPQDLSNLALASPVVQYIRPGSYPVFVRPKSEQGFWVFSGAIYRRGTPYGELQLEGGRAGECWQVVTLSKALEDFLVPDQKKTVLVPAADSSSSPYAGGADLSTAAASLGSSSNWLTLRGSMKELQFTFAQSSGVVTFYVQTATGQIVVFDTLDLSGTNAQTYRATFPGVRVWVRAPGSSYRVYVDAIYEVG